MMPTGFMTGSCSFLRRDGSLPNEGLDMFVREEYLFSDPYETDLPPLHHPMEGGSPDMKIGEDILDTQEIFEIWTHFGHILSCRFNLSISS